MGHREGGGGRGPTIAHLRGKVREPEKGRCITSKNMTRIHIRANQMKNRAEKDAAIWCH